MEQKSNIASVVLIIALIASYFFFQNKIDTLESQLESPATVSATVEETSSFVASDDNSLKAQLDDLNSQLITSRGELKSVQQKLILSTSKSQVLEDEVAQMKDARPELTAVKVELESTKVKLETEGQVSQVSQEKYDRLAAALTETNLQIAVRNSNRISLLKETSSAASITAAVVPLLSIATLVQYTRDEIKNYCSDIEEMLALENEALGEIKSITGVVMEKFTAQCR